MSLPIRTAMSGGSRRTRARILRSARRNAGIAKTGSVIPTVPRWFVPKSIVTPAASMREPPTPKTRADGVLFQISRARRAPTTSPETSPALMKTFKPPPSSRIDRMPDDSSALTGNPTNALRRCLSSSAPETRDQDCPAMMEIEKNRDRPHDEVERQQDRRHLARLLRDRAVQRSKERPSRAKKSPSVPDADSRDLKRSEEERVEGGPMPERHEREGPEDRQRGAAGRLLNRREDVVLRELAHRHVIAAPERGQVGGDERPVHVLRQADADHPAHSPGDVAVGLDKEVIPDRDQVDPDDRGQA